LTSRQPPLTRAKGACRKAYKALSPLLVVVEAVVVVKLRCPYCGYIWEYKGKKTRYATCPNCLRKVDIQKNRVE
jgi:rubrerythrin